MTLQETFNLYACKFKKEFDKEKVKEKAFSGTDNRFRNLFRLMSVELKIWTQYSASTLLLYASRAEILHLDNILAAMVIVCNINTASRIDIGIFLILTFLIESEDITMSIVQELYTISPDNIIHEAMVIAIGLNKHIDEDVKVWLKLQ